MKSGHYRQPVTLAKIPEVRLNPRYMSRSDAVIPATVALSGGCAVVMALWAGMPWYATAALAVSAVEAFSSTRRQADSKWSLALLAFCAVVVIGTFFIGRFFVPGAGLAGWMAGICVLQASRQLAAPANRRWLLAGMGWLWFGGFAWLVSAYFQNLLLAFYAGLLINVMVLAGCERWIQLSAMFIQLVNTLILLLILLPFVDLVLNHRHPPGAALDPGRRYYRYDSALRDPEGYFEWRRAEGGELRRLLRRITVNDPTGRFPFRLCPGTRGTLFSNTIAINSLGFRNREIAIPKGDAYRIVALGESTTFGLTVDPGQKPWPELLETMIRERLKPPRPVEVINAGVLAYTLRHNLIRLPEQILPLKPDLIISYHGLNGFPMIFEGLPDLFVRETPVYYERPLKLLADCEFAFRVWRFNRQRMARLSHRSATVIQPLETDYARAYEQLIDITRTNGIHLVLANYSMAVNRDSDPHLVEFYRRVYPVAYLDIDANEVHSHIVKQLSEMNPGVIFIDTHPGLDGVHDQFTDLIHFTREGDEQLAETFFAGITNFLMHEWSRSQPVSGRE